MLHIHLIAVLGISIHALREEGDWRGLLPLQVSRNFYPRPPRGGRPECVGTQCRALQISIHALREEGDSIKDAPFPRASNTFLSKPSARLATPAHSSNTLPVHFISTPSARRATKRSCASLLLFLFLSTPSARRATQQQQGGKPDTLISIHALREEGDGFSSMYLSIASYFYPRPPRGGRRLKPNPKSAKLRISIHALREEGDGRQQCAGLAHCYFYPRPPRGGRRVMPVRSANAI